jgi:nicotinamide mononucleotide adenylyltransferase
MMMKVLMGTLVLIAVCWTPHISHAAGPDSMLEKCMAMRQRLEKGMKSREYFREFQQLYMEYKLANAEKYRELVQLYMDLRDQWYATLLSNKPRFNYYDYFIFKSQYQKMTNSSHWNKINIRDAICEAIAKSILLEKGLQ